MFTAIATSLLLASSVTEASHVTQSMHKAVSHRVKSVKSHYMKDIMHKVDAKVNSMTDAEKEAAHKRRSLGSGVNGVSYLVTAIFNEPTCGHSSAGVSVNASFVGASSLSVHSDCIISDDGDGTSIRLVGCAQSDQKLTVEVFQSLDCTGDSQEVKVPMDSSCSLDSESQVYFETSCGRVWPFKNMPGLLISSYENPEKCMANDTGNWAHLAMDECFVGMKLHSCENNKVHASQYKNLDCTGDYSEEIDKFKPNSKEVCDEVDEDNGEGDDFPYESTKCSNNHLYKKG